MKLDKAKGIVVTLQPFLVKPYWVHSYYLLQNALLPKENWEYDVYVEYNGEFDLEKFGELIGLLGGLTYTIAISTRQIIIW